MKIQALTARGNTKRAIVKTFWDGSYFVSKAGADVWKVDGLRECSNDTQIKLNNFFDAQEQLMDEVKRL